MAMAEPPPSGGDRLAGSFPVGWRLPAIAIDWSPSTAGDQTGAYAWPAGVALAAQLGALADWQGRKVADLGCGRGHVGCAALALDAAHVHFTDGQPAAMTWLAALIAANRLGARTSFALHRWGDQVPGAPYDRIVGGDILYRGDLHGALLDTIAQSLAEDGECLLSDPRQHLEAALPALARARGLTWTSQRQERYTLVRIRRLT